MCDQVCVNEPGGFRCECKEGYKLVGSIHMGISFQANSDLSVKQFA